ncbi:MAG: hypothetical protein EZS28_039469 [Streblomastix strix]|uniref:Uncharacterized protein n=1 Tax=Streblomastix strix TaxID=222440 RepID=A0A5J4U3P2_9EUKA|nr:MAG: hypothetical protein EZS28_039469 [Streblomastix strix]
MAARRGSDTVQTLSTSSSSDNVNVWPMILYSLEKICSDAYTIVEYFSDKDLCLEFFKRIEREYDLWKDLLNRLTTELQGSRKPIAWESRKTPSDPFKDILVRLVLPKDTEEQLTQDSNFIYSYQMQQGAVNDLLTRKLIFDKLSPSTPRRKFILRSQIIIQFIF